MGKISLILLIIFVLLVVLGLFYYVNFTDKFDTPTKAIWLFGGLALFGIGIAGAKIKGWI